MGPRPRALFLEVLNRLVSWMLFSTPLSHFDDQRDKYLESHVGHLEPVPTFR